ncbi:MAG: IPT/TIG domain-containing protein [Treponema sp.]|nr:IPT/TIG domain-containing protein [Treponema sp.]
MNRFSYTLRKRAAARFFILALFVAAGIFLLTFFSRFGLRSPVLTEISPSVGSAGDILVLRGQNFGSSRGSSYVELCGNRLTESGYVSWDDDLIKVIVPGNTEDGLVYVATRAGKSNPEFFANELAIPVEMPENPMFSVPIITELSLTEATPGQIISISGRNFGSSRGESNVYFSARREGEREESVPNLDGYDTKVETQKYVGFLTPSEADFDFEYWSENEIRVRVPDGAASGSVFVATSEGRSALQPFLVKSRVGKKTWTGRHTYLIQVGADFHNIKGGDAAAVTIHLPRPIVSALQPEAIMTESNPEPALLDYRGNSIFQITPADKTSAKNYSGARQNYVVTSCGMESEVYKDYVGLFKEKDRMLYKAYTRADEIIPADDKAVLELLPKIVFQVKNPYRQAELVFDYFVQNYKILPKTRNGDANPLDLIVKKRGDAYDFAVLYAALLRCAGVPCRILSGVLIDSDKQTRNHWWNEFYIENFGWLPVDTALGAGMEFKAFQGEPNSGKYFFGNIDAQRVAFSFAYKAIKQSLLSNKTVSMPRSFALQSIWEESTADVESYSSYWIVPAVLGIY